MSAAPAAIAFAVSSMKVLGLAKWSCDSPMVFIARAVAPMLPGCVVSLRTMRRRDRRSLARTADGAVWIGTDLDFPPAHVAAVNHQ